MYKKLRRSRRNAELSGVCAGIAEFLGIKTSNVRVAWFLLTLLYGSGILLYIVLACIIPQKEAWEEEQEYNYYENNYYENNY